MADLNVAQQKLISDLSLTGTRRQEIADTVHCAPRTVDNHLEHLFPRDGSSGTYKLRTRRKGRYKGVAQKLVEVRDYVTKHRFCTNRDIIRDLQLNVTSVQTISNWLSDLGIGTYTAATKPFISPVNKRKR